NHVAAITNVRSRARLVGLDVIRAEHLSFFREDKGLARHIHPEALGLVPGDVARIGIGFACDGDLAEDRPDLLKVCPCSFTNIHARKVLEMKGRSSKPQGFVRNAINRTGLSTDRQREPAPLTTTTPTTVPLPAR